MVSNQSKANKRLGREKAISDDEILRIVHEQTKNKPVTTTTTEITEETPLTRDGVYKRLRQLLEAGRLECIVTEGRNDWYVTEKE